MEPLLGTVELFSFNWPPKGWMKCEGQMLPVSQYMQLFSLIGTTYGGDGMNTFKLPDLRGKEPQKGMSYCIVVEGIYPQRP